MVEVCAGIQAPGQQVPGLFGRGADLVPWPAVQPVEDPVQRAQHRTGGRGSFAGPDLTGFDTRPQVAAQALEHSDVVRLHLSAVFALQGCDLQQDREMRTAVFLGCQPVLELQQEQLPRPFQRAAMALFDFIH